MKSRLVILICIGILFIVLFMNQSVVVVNDEFEEKPETSHHQIQTRELNDQPNHLFYFVQVLIEY